MLSLKSHHCIPAIVQMPSLICVLLYSDNATEMALLGTAGVLHSIYHSQKVS